MALWGRLGANSDNHPNGNIAYELFNAVLQLWITGSANGGLSGAEAAAALQLDGDETTQANRLRVALLALADDAERREAAGHLHAVMNAHEFQIAEFNTGLKVEQSLVDWFAAKGVTF